MRAIGKHALFIAVSFLIVFIALFALSFAFYPDPLWIDTDQSSETAFKVSRTIYIGEPRHVVLGRHPLMENSSKVLLMGSSNVREGFRPEAIKEYLPGYTIHNLAVGASNITQIREILSLADEYLPTGRAGDVVVLGIWYGLFVDDQTRWKNGRTDIANEMVRFGLYKTSESGALEPAILCEHLDLCIDMLRPYLLIDKWISRFSSTIKYKLSCIVSTGECHAVENVDRDSIVVDAGIKEKAMRFWYDYMGRDQGRVLRDEQFIALQDLAMTLHRQGRVLIIVDLPIARWHSGQSGHFRNYQQKKRPFIDGLVKSRKAHYLDLQNLDDDSDFYDSAHPRPSKAVRWSGCLAEKLQEIVAADSPVR